MKKTTLLLIAVIAFFTGCETASQQGPDLIQPYTSFKPGTYWIYEWIKQLDDGTELTLNRLDSVYIAGDSVISGKRYRVKKGTNLFSPFFTISRDSGKFELSQDSKVLFFIDPSYHEVDTVRYEGPDLTFIHHLSFNENKTDVTVPAGTFSTVEFNDRIKTPLEELNPCVKYYAKGIGLVKYKCTVYPQGAVLTQRLVRYQIVE